MQQTKPLVSIIIPAYNHELFIEETIDSVLDQTFQNFELIKSYDRLKNKLVSSESKIKIDPLIEILEIFTNG